MTFLSIYFSASMSVKKMFDKLSETKKPYLTVSQLKVHY